MAAATNYTLEKNGFPQRTTDEVRMFVGNGIRKLIERALPAGTSETVQEQAFADFNVYYKAHCADTTCTYPGVLELLQEARRLGCKTAIVSNKADYGVQELAKQYFPGLLDAACGEQAGVAKKPAPDMVWEALKRLGCSKDDAIYVGDSDVDKETADNADLDVALVTWGFRDRDFLKSLQPTYLIDTREELGALFGV